MFHYWNGSGVEVIYFLPRKVIAKPDVSRVTSSWEYVLSRGAQS